MNCVHIENLEHVTLTEKKENVLKGFDLTDIEHNQVKSLSELKIQDKEALEEVGTIIENIEEERNASFLQFDQTVVNISNSYENQLEIMPISQALEKYDWLREKYFWKAVLVEKDAITEAVDSLSQQGYFIRALSGYKGGDKPVQACLYLTKENSVYMPQNLFYP